jgi:hypothetical protein
LQDLYFAESCDLAKLFLQDIISCVNRAYLGRKFLQDLYLAESCSLVILFLQDIISCSIKSYLGNYFLQDLSENIARFMF